MDLDQKIITLVHSRVISASNCHCHLDVCAYRLIVVASIWQANENQSRKKFLKYRNSKTLARTNLKSVLKAAAAVVVVAVVR